MSVSHLLDPYNIFFLFIIENGNIVAPLAICSTICPSTIRGFASVLSPEVPSAAVNPRFRR